MARMATSGRIIPASAIAALCLGFTGSATAWADESQEVPVDVRAKWVDSPYAPHDTTGSTFRLGTLVGVEAVDGREYTALGGLVAAGHRWGRLAVDAEYGYLELTARGPSSVRYGVAHELGVGARFDVLRFGSHVVGPNSMAAIYVEGTVSRQLRRGDPVSATDAPRELLPSGSANRLAGGFGFTFDHRLEQPRGFPNRIAWQLGWRVIGAPRPEPDSLVTCRGPDCVAAPSPQSPTRFGLGETSLLVSSSLAFTW